MHKVIIPKDSLKSVQLRSNVDFRKDCACPKGSEDKCINILCPRK